MQAYSIAASEKRALHIDETSALYGISRSKIYDLMATGVLRTVKIGGRRLVPRDAIEALISEVSKAVSR